MWLGEESTETQQLFQPPADPSDLNLAAACSLAAELDVQLYGSTATIKRLVLRRNPPLPLPTTPPAAAVTAKFPPHRLKQQHQAAARSQRLHGVSLLEQKRKSDSSFPYFCNWANFLPSPQLAWDLAQPNTRWNGGESAAKLDFPGGARWQRQHGTTNEKLGSLLNEWPILFQNCWPGNEQKMFLSSREFGAIWHIWDLVFQ